MTVSDLGGTFTPSDTTLTLKRMGYGSMQLPGPHVWGPPRDRQAALAVLRAVVERGANHIDTAQFYGPDVSNQLIREALWPYPANLTIATKVGARRDAQGGWLSDLTPEGLRADVHRNLETLGLGTLEIVNLRLGGAQGPDDASLQEPLQVLIDLQRQGLIRHLGLSNASPAQYAEARAMTPVICVQNHYNLVTRHDDAFIDALAADGVAYVPFFPLGGFSPLQSARLSQVAEDTGTTPLQVALAWLLRRSPNILVIAGTSSLAHLHENLAAADLDLSDAHLKILDGIASQR